MSTDFRAERLRTSAIIASRSDAGNPSLIIYSASDASDFTGGIADSNLLAGAGPDVFFFVSGSTSHRGQSHPSAAVALFGGDLVVSGTLFAERQVIEVNEVTTGSLLVSGNLVVSRSAEIFQDIKLNSQGASTGYVNFNSTAGSTGYGFRQSAGTMQFKHSGGDWQDISGLLYVTGTFNVPTPRNYVTTASVSIAGGEGLAHNISTVGTDAYFYVSGSTSAPANANDNKSIFGGDTFISGTLVVGGENFHALAGSSVGGTISGSIHETSGGLSYLVAGDNITITSASNGQITIDSTSATYSAGDGLDLSGTTFSTDLKANSGLIIDSTELSIDDGIIATISGSTFTGPVTHNGPTTFNKQNYFIGNTFLSGNVSDFTATGSVNFNAGLSGSLTRLTDGTSYLIAGEGISIASASNGGITITGNVGDITGVTAGTGLTGGGTSANVTVSADYAGADSFIMAATDGTGITVDGSNDKLALYDNDAATIKYVNANQVGSTYTAGDGLDLTGTTFSTDIKANSGLIIDSTELSIDDGIIATISGATFTGPVTLNGPNTFKKQNYFLDQTFLSGTISDFTATGSANFNAGLSGSLTRLTDGSSYIIAGDNITVTSASNGAVTIAATDTNTTYTAGDGLDLSGTTFSTDLKANSGLIIDSTELSIDDGIIATISGSTFTGPVTHNGPTTFNKQNYFIGNTFLSGNVSDFTATGSANFTIGLSGSLTRLTNGKSFIEAGSNITVTSASNGAITISSTGGFSSWTIEGDSGSSTVSSGQSVDIAGGTGITTSESSRTLTVNLDYQGTDNFIDVASNLEGSAIDPGDTIVYHDANDNNVKKGFVSDLPFAAGTMSSFDISDGNSTQTIENGNTLTFNAGTGIDPSVTATDTVTMAIDNDVVATISGSTFTGATLHNAGLSGSLTRLTDGKSYIIAGDNITVTSASNGSVTIASTGGSGTVDGSGVAERVAFWFDSDTLTSDADLTFDGTDLGVGNKIVHVGDADTYINFTDDDINIRAGGANMVSFSEGSQDEVVFNGATENIDFRVQSDDYDHFFFVDADENRISIGRQGSTPESLIHIKDTSPEVRIQRQLNGQDSVISFAGSGGVRGSMTGLAGGTNDIVFKTFNSVTLEETARFGGDYSGEGRGIILLSGSEMAAGAMQPRESKVINFFVSGAIGSKGTAVKGTAVFGGDMAVSGVLHIHGSEDFQSAETAAIVLDGGYSRIVWDSTGSPSELNPDAQIYEAGNTLYVSSSKHVYIHANQSGSQLGDLWLRSADQIYMYPGNRIQILQDINHTGQFVGMYAQQGEDNWINVLDVRDDGVVINEASNSAIDFRVESNNLQSMLNLDSGLNTIMIGSNQATVVSEATRPGAGLGTDVQFYISGSRNALGYTGGGVTAFVGDLYVSGAIYEDDQTLLSAGLIVDADSAPATTANTEYSVFDSSNFSSGNWYAESCTRKNVTWTESTGVLSIPSGSFDGAKVTHGKRPTLLTFNIYVQSLNTSAEITVRVRNGGLSGPVKAEYKMFVMNNGYENGFFSCILDPGVDPCITLQNEGATGVSAIRAGSGFTWKNT